MQEEINEYEMEFDLQLLARFLSINIYIFSPIQNTNNFEIDNTETIVFKATIAPFNNEDSSLPYITVVRRGIHYEPAMATASGCVWLLPITMQERADSQMSSFHDPTMRFGTINERPKHPIRRGGNLGNEIIMKDIHHMRQGQFFTDNTLDGFLAILNYKYMDKMDYAHTKFLAYVRRTNYQPRRISNIMRSRI